MLKTLMAALDGTEASEPVLQLAIRWARRLDATLAALTVVDEPSLHGSEELLVGEAYFRKLNKELLDDLRSQADQALSRYAIRCAEAHVAFKPLQEEGVPAEQILREAQRFDLILLPRHAHARFGWPGAVAKSAAQVLKNSPRPVVVVPESTENLVQDGPVVVAYDASLQAARALASFVNTGLGADRPIHIVSVAEERLDAARAADFAATYLDAHGLSARVHALASPEPPTVAILDVIRGEAAELLVMGAYGQPGLKEFFLGSTTRSALADSPVPVLVDH